MHPGQVLPEQQNEEKMHGWLSQDGDFCNWPFVKDAAGTVIPPSIAYVHSNTPVSRKVRVSLRPSVTLPLYLTCGWRKDMYDDVGEAEKEGGGEGGGEDGGQCLPREMRYSSCCEALWAILRLWVAMEPGRDRKRGKMARSDRRARRVSNPAHQAPDTVALASMPLGSTRCWQPRS